MLSPRLLPFPGAVLPLSLSITRYRFCPISPICGGQWDTPGAIVHDHPQNLRVIVLLATDPRLGTMPQVAPFAGNLTSGMGGIEARCPGLSRIGRGVRNHALMFRVFKHEIMRPVSTP